MVASALFIMDLKGKIIISRNFRGDVPMTASETFRFAARVAQDILVVWPPLEEVKNVAFEPVAPDVDHPSLSHSAVVFTMSRPIFTVNMLFALLRHENEVGAPLQCMSVVMVSRGLEVFNRLDKAEVSSRSFYIPHACVFASSQQHNAHTASAGIIQSPARCRESLRT